ncbi:MAG: hypothetical protein ACK4UO_06510 [Pseudolabrys sp.]
MPHRQHPTTRRTFIASLGFGGVALYGAWAAYGAAPLPFFPSGGRIEATEGHGGHGGPSIMAPEEFLRRHEEFVARFSRPDGSIVLGGAETPAAPAETPAPAAGHDAHGAAQHGALDAHQPQAPTDHGHGAVLANAGATEPTDLYLLAYRFGFAPDDIRLELGKPYRLRMMSPDITHGASLQLGRGSRVIRLRPNVVSEQTITFNRPGPVLVYCTTFCGPGHDVMKARILVA